MTLRHPSERRTSTRWMIFATVLFAYISLVIVDKDTHSIQDVVNARIVPALVLYCVPGYFLSKILVKRFSTDERFFSLLKPMAIVVVVSFLLVMGFAVLLKESGLISSY